MESEMDVELHFHIEAYAEDLMRRGIPRSEALRRARIEFGSIERAKEECRDARGVNFLESVLQDLRFGLRMTRKNPGFALTVVMTLGLGIGAATTMFSVIYAVLLKPLEYREPNRLVRVSGGATPIRFEQIKSGAHLYEGIGAFAVGMENMTLSGAFEPEVLRGARVSANFLDVLGVRPLAGRGFLQGEDVPGGPTAVILSADLWQRRFAGDPQILGKSAVLEAVPHTIVGVLPSGFEFPFPRLDVWVTRPSEWSIVPPPSRALSPILSVFARLKPGVDINAATAELAVINRQYAMSYPKTLDSKPNTREQVRLLRDQMVATVHSMLWMLVGAVSFVLLIACANVASMALVRATSRVREFAVRGTLGAPRGRLIEQLVIENLLLTSAGAVVGLLLAKGGLQTLKIILADQLPRAHEIRIDGAVLLFTLLLSAITGVVFGLTPSLEGWRLDLSSLLKATSQGANSIVRNGLSRRVNLRSLLIVAQVALTIVLLIGTSLLMQSIARLHSVSLGFQSANVVTMRISLPPARYDTTQKQATFFEQLVERVQSLPGVTNAAATLTLPLTGFAGSTVHIVEQPPVETRQIAVVQNVTNGYFQTLAIPVKRGRTFSARDNQDSTPVAIINESLARRFWPAYPDGLDPVGQHIMVGSNPLPLEIVGIIGDVRQTSLDSDPRPGVYRPFAQNPSQSAMIAIRSDGDPLGPVAAVHRQVRSIDRDQPISDIRTMDNIVEASLGQRRVIMLLLQVFAALAVTLTVVGMYGLIAYAVAQRRNELGIRRAIGAQKHNILWLVVSRGLSLASLGIVIGIAGAVSLSRVIKNFLFGVSATDPSTYVAVAMLVGLVALAASYIPAQRATRGDPMVALRHE